MSDTTEAELLRCILLRLAALEIPGGEPLTDYEKRLCRNALFPVQMDNRTFSDSGGIGMGTVHMPAIESLALDPFTEEGASDE